MKMRPRASWKKLDCIFTLSKWILLLVCLLSLTPRGIIAQNESETFESAFGLNLPESIEKESTEEIVSLPPQTKETLEQELEDLVVEEQDFTPIDKEDVETPVQVLPKVKNAFAAKGKDKTGTDSVIVQNPPDKISKEKTAKYVRYGK